MRRQEDGRVGAHRGRADGRARRRAGLRAVWTAAAVLLGVSLLAGVGSAAPLLSSAPVAAAGSLVNGITGDSGAGGVARDNGVPVPEVPPCLPPTRACVDLSTSRAWLLDNGRVVRGPVPIIPGDPDTPTPRGDFKVQWKASQYTSRQFLVQMPWSVFFADGGIAFHAGDPDTYTAGCVKLHEDDAKAFFDFLQVGDPVHVV